MRISFLRQYLAITFVLSTGNALYAGATNDTNKENSVDEKNRYCDSIFCQTTSLINGTVSTQEFTGTASTFTNTTPPPPTVTNNNFDVFMVPILFPEGFGNDFSISSCPIICNGKIIAPPDRINILNCGWYKVNFYGSATFTATFTQESGSFLT